MGVDIPTFVGDGVCEFRVASIASLLDRPILRVTCSPTWAQPLKSGASLFVACNGSSEIVEIDVHAWKVVRRIPARAGVYNLAITNDAT